MKSKLLLTGMLFLGLLGACQRYGYDDYLINTDKSKANEIKIAVVSDIHYMDPSLLVHDGSAFQAYLAHDPKLLVQSDTILRATIKLLIAQHPDLVLIAGDLTKDGEKVSHQSVANLLKQLTCNGIKVLVTVGNHDVSNPEAFKFDGDNVIPVQTVTPADILSIYSDFGFGNAICKDPNSLSYVNEPFKKFWVIVIDANEYYNNTTQSTVAGTIKPATMAWIKERLAEAKKKGITIIGMMHHNVLEHFVGQSEIDPGYVVDDWQTVSEELMNAGLTMMFTGHYHSNDIVKRTIGNKFLFDVETGSMVQYPCTYRILNINSKKYSFKSWPVSLLLGSQFDLYAKTFLRSHLDGYFHYLLVHNFALTDSAAMIGAPLYTDASIAHFSGDEVLTNEEYAKIIYFTGPNPAGSILGSILLSLWTDPNTKDNTLTINMANGSAN
ncbi:MAG: metallophosphoesterase [Bacteroidota bacterium]|nr:metallophosphoesterase [Bacteroidota bacterium]MDP4274646.1 metallophosphoesterase [Bacteroidota bacterium]